MKIGMALKKILMQPMKSDSSIIADSSGLISLTIPTDSNYIRAIELSTCIERDNKVVYIPTEVFSETINTMDKKFGHSLSCEYAQKVLTADTYQVIDSSEEIRTKALEIFKNQSHSVSFTDCIVMAVADFYETKLIFGFDEIFKRNGYGMG